MYYEAGIVAYVYNLELSGAFNIREAVAGGSLWIWSQSDLQSKFS